MERLAFHSRRRRHGPRSAFLLAGCGLIVGVMSALSAQENGPEVQTAPRLVAAEVNDIPIFVDEVGRELRRVLGNRQTDQTALRFLQAKTLQQLIDRQLILAWLAEKGQVATDQDIELAQSRLEKRLSARGMTIAAYLERLEMQPGDLARALRWQLSWQRFLDRYLSEKNLQSYFLDHRIEFDGTQVRVAHLLLKADGNDPAALSDALVRAKDIHQSIRAGMTTFAEAARQHSQAPSGKDGGDIGFISRREPMPEPFSREAFALQKGAMSEPVISQFGVHLIYCLEIKPGAKQWTDVRPALERGVTEYLFTWAADRRRNKVPVTFTGELPHFQPGTETVVE